MGPGWLKWIRLARIRSPGTAIRWRPGREQATPEPDHRRTPGGLRARRRGLPAPDVRSGVDQRAAAGRGRRGRQSGGLGPHRALPGTDDVGQLHVAATRRVPRVRVARSGGRGHRRSDGGREHPAVPRPPVPQAAAVAEGLSMAPRPSLALQRHDGRQPLDRTFAGKCRERPHRVPGGLSPPLHRPPAAFRTGRRRPSVPGFSGGDRPRGQPVQGHQLGPGAG